MRKYVDPEPSHGAWISLNSTTYMHGKHSWHVIGDSNDDVVIEQTLSSEVVEYIWNRIDGQNRGVCFSFLVRRANGFRRASLFTL